MQFVCTCFLFNFWLALHWHCGCRFTITSFCISEHLTSIHIKMLRLATVTYPIVLIIITCILMELHARHYRIINIVWKPFSIILNKASVTIQCHLIAVYFSCYFHHFYSVSILHGCTDICLDLLVPEKDWPSQHLLRLFTTASKTELETTECWLDSFHQVYLQQKHLNLPSLSAPSFPPF